MNYVFRRLAERGYRATFAKSYVLILADFNDDQLTTIIGPPG